MATFLILAPFGAFAMLTLLTSAKLSLFAGSATALGHSLRVLRGAVRVVRVDAAATTGLRTGPGARLCGLSRAGLLSLSGLPRLLRLRLWLPVLRTVGLGRLCRILGRRLLLGRRLARRRWLGWRLARRRRSLALSFTPGFAITHRAMSGGERSKWPRPPRRFSTTAPVGLCTTPASTHSPLQNIQSDRNANPAPSAGQPQVT